VIVNIESNTPLPGTLEAMVITTGRTTLADTPPAHVDTPERRRARIVAWAALAINIAVILWGAVVRATGSGAGCGNHWPLCNGDVVPQDPSITTLIEFSHRLSSGVALLATVALGYHVWRAYPFGHRVRLGTMLAAATIIVESLLGAGLVLLDMVAQNRSLARGWWVGGHLVNTLALLSAFTAVAVWATGTTRPRLPREGHRLRLFAFVMLAMLIMGATGATGAITALGDTLFPASSIAEGLAQKEMADAHPFVKMRYWHPAIAVAAALALGLAGRALAEASPSLRGRRLADSVAIACLAQLGVGALNVLLLAPVWMQLVHLAMADTIWIGATWMILECLATDDTRAPRSASDPVAQGYADPSRDK
jgi:heme A synthase